jgi:tRNA U34 5-methylaminomethyl-2-thiouridine-forming methyltransferase MnmC
MLETEETFERVILTTADGSHTLFVPSMNEHYHSYHGALEESQYVYIQQGLYPLIEREYKHIRILEIGLGTGLNALLTSLQAEENQIPIFFTSVEAFPLQRDEYEKLNYPDLITHAKAMNEYNAIHESEWGSIQQINAYFSLNKVNSKIEDFACGKEQYDLIYFDAFAPNKQPELWTDEMFAKIFKAMRPGGILVTYCAKSDVRRSMLSAGFGVERLQGPPHKREMLRANKA